MLLSLLIGTQEPRQLVACLLLFTQCLVILRLSRIHAVPGGRAHRILMIGAGISPVAEDITGMLLKAYAALYRAKHAGRNTQVLSTAD